MKHSNHVRGSLSAAAALAVIILTGGSSAIAGGHKTTTGDIVDVAAGAGSFNTLVTAAKAADLVDALKGDGPLTVFAPTDEAFAALPEGTVDTLLLPENKDKLRAVLLYHVVSGKIMADDLRGKTDAETLEGATLEIKGGWSAKKVTVNGANVVSADVPASNGVIHVIDAVLLPPES